MSATKLEVRQDGVYILHNVHASYPHLDKANNMPGEMDPEKARYKLSALIKVDHIDVFTELKKACAALVPKGKTISKPPFAEVLPEKLPQSWTDAYGVSALQVRFQNKAKPKLFGENGQPAKEGEIKAGDIVSIAFQPFTFSNNYGQFLSLQLLAVRKNGNDLEFGGAGAPEIGADAFGTVVKPTVDSDPFGDAVPF